MLPFKEYSCLPFFLACPVITVITTHYSPACDWSWCSGSAEKCWSGQCWWCQTLPPLPARNKVEYSKVYKVSLYCQIKYHFGNYLNNLPVFAEKRQ